jgi:hypothetical protein
MWVRASFVLEFNALERAETKMVLVVMEPRETRMQPNGQHVNTYIDVGAVLN